MDAFDALMATLDYPVIVVTAGAGDDRDGCLVGFATQASISPARFLVGLSERNRTFRIARRSSHLGVHLVSADDLQLAELFGGQTGDEIDKLARVPWREGPGAVPLLDDLPNRFVGRILARLPLGDHVGHLLEPTHAWHVDGPARPLTVGRAAEIEPGHEP